MPYSLLNHIRPVIIHAFLIRLFQSSAVVLFITLAWAKSQPEKPSAAKKMGSAVASGLQDSVVGPRAAAAQPPMAASMFADMDAASNLASQPHWLVGFGSGPTWLSGIPGAVLFYILGAVWLLLPDRYFMGGVSGQVSRWTRYVIK